MNNSTLQEAMAARRVVGIPCENKDINCPTGVDRSIEIKEKNGALSNKKAGAFLSKFIKPEHKIMSRMLGCALTLGTVEAWAGFRFVALMRMTEVERHALAYMSLTALAPEHVECTAADAIGVAGKPLPAFLGGMDDARSWASWASRNELKAYALAAFEAMTPADQAAFYQHISIMEVAA